MVFAGSIGVRAMKFIVEAMVGSLLDCEVITGLLAAFFRDVNVFSNSVRLLLVL